MKSKHLFLATLLLLILFTGLIIPKLFPYIQPLPLADSLPTIASPETPTPKILKIIEHYEPPTVPVRPAYTLIFVGDSMTESLGINFDALRLGLKEYYPEKVFGLFNYGFGSTNILSADDRLHQDSNYQGRSQPAILSRTFDIVIIESFGHNPLSQYPLEQGLAMQTEALDHLVAEIVDASPDSLIIFLNTIAPSQRLYGKNAIDLSPEQRNLWANERRTYIENHTNYATGHNIPLIDVYGRSIDQNGLTITKYLNPNDYIHPSGEGVHLISQTIANYLFQNNILLN